MKRKWSEPAQARVKSRTSRISLRSDRILIQRKRRQATARDGEQWRAA
jgi:hypothetical protein